MSKLLWLYDDPRAAIELNPSCPKPARSKPPRRSAGHLRHHSRCEERMPLGRPTIAGLHTPVMGRESARISARNPYRYIGLRSKIPSRSKMTGSKQPWKNTKATFEKNSVKAIVYSKYGPPDVLELREVARPTPKDDEVLVKVHAASVNSWDWDLLRGKPFLVRLVSFGLLKPKYGTLGADIAGRVEAVGKNVSRLRRGEDVFGDISDCGWGGFAEYVCVRENVLALKSDSMTFAEAAAIPQAALLALQGLRDKKQIQPGHKVLIIGAGGGVGTFALQIAKLFGAEVTGVDHTAKLEMMRSVGADHVIDYTKQDFTKNGKRYDLILDAVAHRSILDYARALSSTGTFVMVGGTTPVILQVAVLGPLISRIGKKEIGILTWHPSTSDLDHMKELFEAGKVVPVIDRHYPLDETAEALRYLGEGHAKGKVVITIEHND